jgi:hypothetical protein
MLCDCSLALWWFGWPQGMDVGFISFRKCSHQVDTGCFLQKESDRGMKPTIHPHLAPKLKMNGAIPGLPHTSSSLS